MLKKITFETVQPFQDLPVLVAHREGLFAKEGLEIEFVKGSERYAVVKTDRNVTNPDGLSSRLGHGSGHASGEAMMYNACEWGNYRRVQDSGDTARQVGRRASVAYGAIIVAPGSSVYTPQQLANVPVGVPYYNGTHYLALQMLEGFLPRDLIKTCQATNRAAKRFRALMDGELDATTVVEPYITVAEKAGCRIVIQSCFHGTEVASDEVDAETYAAFKRAVKEAVRRVNADKRKYVQYFIDYYKDDPLVAALTPEDFNLGRIQVVEPGPIPEEELRRTYEWMVSWNLIDTGLGTDDLVQTDVMEKAQQLANR